MNRWQTNVLIDGSGNVLIADFGLSLVAAEAGNLTFCSVQTGNNRWMAPEFLTYTDDPESPLKPTKPGDIYSFGCVMLQVRYIAIIQDSLLSHHGLRSFQEKNHIRGSRLRYKSFLQYLVDGNPSTELR